MIGKLCRYLFHAIVYATIFLGLVWLLLGIPPQEAWLRTRNNLGRLTGRASHFAGDFGKTTSDMKDVANYHLKQASDRINGIDPYERVAKQFDDSVRQAQQ